MPEKPTNRGPQKTTREDWINTALELLISEGVEGVKVQRIAQQLDCPRSSFYWYFSNRTELLDKLLEIWKTTNSTPIIERAGWDAPTVNTAVMHVFCCWVNDTLFHRGLDFKVREWSTRDDRVRAMVEKADEERIAAIARMFERYDYEQEEALVRARIVYFTQIGYFVLNLNEGAEARLRLSPQYVYCHTGQFPTDSEMQVLYDAFERFTAPAETLSSE